jgi:manganese efflux pump family protein
LIAKVIVLAALGLDTLAVAISFGLTGMPRSRWVRVALIIAIYSVLMPVIGLLAGDSLSDRGASAAVYLAGLGLIGAGVYGLWTIPSAGKEESLVVEAVLEEDVIDETKLPAKSIGPSTQTLHTTAILGSVDKLAVGLALGATDVRPFGALIYLAIQSFVLALLGISFGQRIGATLGHRAEVLSKVLLIGIGALIIVSQLFDLKFITDG